MIHVVLWLCIAACVSVLVGLGVVITLRPRVRRSWYAVFVAIVALLAVVFLVYGWQYVCFVYLDGGSPALDLSLFATTVATYAALVVLVPFASVRARGSTFTAGEWVLVVGIGAAVAAASIFGVQIRPPFLRRLVLAARYAVLAAAFFWSYGTSFARGGASSAPFYTRFSLFSGVAFVVIAIDAVAIRFSLSAGEQIPDGVLSLLVYGVVVGVVILRFAAQTPRAIRSESAVPDTFLLEYGITRREGEIIRCLMEGCTNNEIGERLFISPRTVDTHFSNIYRKCEVRSRLELARLISRTR
jgi:DNA-binding CsgD family transcriptional regulator